MFEILTDKSGARSASVSYEKLHEALRLRREVRELVKAEGKYVDTTPRPELLPALARQELASLWGLSSWYKLEIEDDGMLMRPVGILPDLRLESAAMHICEVLLLRLEARLSHDEKYAENLIEKSQLELETLIQSL